MAKEEKLRTIKRNNDRRIKAPLPLRILKGILCVVLVVILLVAGFVGYLTITEFDPEPEEPVAAEGEASLTLKTGEPLRIASWNVGYGSLGDNADFFMDGGKGVKTADDVRTNENMINMVDVMSDIEPDFFFLQEIDRKSLRSNNVNEVEMMKEAFPGMEYIFSQNFKCDFVPFPIPPIGWVDSGILTGSRFKTGESKRVALPCPFKWPVSVGNLKRCLTVTRMPVEGTDKEFVLVNLHLEAYDNGEGKVAQTAMLREILTSEYEKGNYVLAGGDFNQTFSNVDLSPYPVYEGLWKAGNIDIEDFDKGFSFYMDNTFPTCRSLDKPYAGADKSTFQYYMLDGFIVSDNIEVSHMETKDYDFKSTDHNPVVMEFMLK